MLTGSLEDSDQGTNVIKNLGAYISMFTFFFIFLILVFICTRLKLMKKKAKEIKDKVIRQTFFNNIIRSVTLSYIETAIQMKVLMETKPESSMIMGI